MKRFVFGVILGVWALNGPAWSQAFNCNFAKAADELTICRDDSLKALDEQMSDRFFKVRQQLPTEGQAQLKAPNRKHLRDRAAPDHPFERLPLEQDGACDGVQAGRGRPEKLAPA